MADTACHLTMKSAVYWCSIRYRKGGSMQCVMSFCNGLRADHQNSGFLWCPETCLTETIRLYLRQGTW